VSLLSWIAPKVYNGGEADLNDHGVGLCKQAKVILDVGCGAGQMTNWFGDRLHSWTRFGLEYSEASRIICKRIGIVPVAGDMNAPWRLQDEAFDLVLSIQSIEHVHNTRLYVEEAYRVLRPGGQFLVLTENLGSWANIGALVLGWQPFSTTNMNDWNIGNPLCWHGGSEDQKQQRINPMMSGLGGHVRVLSYCGLEDILAKVGFEQTTMFTEGYVPLWGWLSRLLCRVDVRHGHFLGALTNRPSM